MNEIDWQTKAEKLWELLDDIDTASDMFKPHDGKSYKAFYDYVMRKCQERGKYMNSLDGRTLIAVEQEEYDNQVNQRFLYLKEWQKQTSKQVEDIIEAETKDMNQDDLHDYIFRWKLVMQEIDMWIRINNPVRSIEIEDMCSVRGFNQSMSKYLRAAVESVYLLEGMKLPITKKQPPEESPQDV